jgi:outer membrane protein OmpA-like peptidoglycan-associated protein
MTMNLTKLAAVPLLVMTGLAAAGIADARQADLQARIVPAVTRRGPDIAGIITARNGDRLQVTAADANKTVLGLTEATRAEARSGLFGLGRNSLAAAQLANGLPVNVRTLQVGDVLIADRVWLKNGDIKTVSMIRGGTAQGFEEQGAATAALRGRFGDIDQYNVKNSVNATFATGKANLSSQAKEMLCATASEAEAMTNALLLIVGHTDSTGSAEFNQRLSKRRAAAVVNHMQQHCGWKPYRMLTPAGMAMSDPVAPNDDIEGRAQTRLVAVNVLVSKAVDGL